MFMSRGFTHRAFCASFGLILCALPGFAQRATKRPAPSVRSHEARIAPNRYIVFLQDDPVISQVTSHQQLQTAAAVAYQQQIESRQQTLIRELGNRKFQVVGSVSTIMNEIGRAHV